MVDVFFCDHGAGKSVAGATFGASSATGFFASSLKVGTNGVIHDLFEGAIG